MRSGGHARFNLGEDEDHHSGSESDHPPPGMNAPQIIVEAVGDEGGRPGVDRTNGEDRSEQTSGGTMHDAQNGEGNDEKYPPAKDEADAAQGTGAEAATKEKKPQHTLLHVVQEAIDPYIGWAKPKMNWKSWRPVLRASIASWAGLTLILATRSQVMLGQAGFLVLIVSVISPAAYPIATMLELTFFQFAIVSTSWAYSAFGLYIAHISRRKYRYSQAQFQVAVGQQFAAQGVAGYDISNRALLEIFHGRYLEPTSSAVCGIFLGVGVGFLLWLRQRLGPGPALFGIIFGIILMIICFTIAVLFPYYYASVGLVFFLPFTCQEAIQLAASFLILPETLGHQFADRLVTTLTPLQGVIETQKDMLATDPRSLDWLKFKTIKSGVQGAMEALALLGASEANLTREVSYGRVSGKDLIKLLKGVRILVARSTGFISFYEIVEKHLHRDLSQAKGGAIADELVIHLGHSRPATPSPSRPASPKPGEAQEQNQHREIETSADPHQLSRALAKATNETDSQRVSAYRSHSHPAFTTSSRNSSCASIGDLHEGLVDNHQSHSRPSSSKRRSKSRTRLHAQHHKNKSSASLLHEILHPNVEIPRPVGMFESQRYMDLEDYLHNPRDEEHLREIMELLAVASTDLLDALKDLVSVLIETIHAFKMASHIAWRLLKDLGIRKSDQKTQEQLMEELGACIERVEMAHSHYRDVRRLDVIRPFAGLFDPISHLGPDGTIADDTFQAPSHRGLFWALSYQFSLISWGEALLDLSKECHTIGKKRQTVRLWTPEWAKFHFATSHPEATFEEESPDSIELINRSVFRAPRDPDHRPPRTALALFGVKFNHFLHFFVRKEFLFAVKLAIVIGVCAMPAFFRTSCYFFYRERGIWPLVMIALTSTLYIGDTTFGFIIRLVGTVAGAIFGLLLWSIAAQTGGGNPFAAGAVMAVAMPLIFFFRLYYTPVPTAIIPTVTTMLVFGYSWQGAHHPSGSSVGSGWPVTWRRMVCVALGVVIAFLVAFIPPKVTQKKAIRKTYANVINSMGGVFCQIVSFAACKEDGSGARPTIILKNLAALRTKISKTTASKMMVRFEWSWAGQWPEQHYTSLQSLQMEMLDSFGQLLSVLASLDKKWTKAMLHRSQLSNPQFLGDMLTTFQLISSALRDGTQLPMIYNPLLERFLKSPETREAHRQYGFEIALNEEDEVEGIPSHVTLETICSIEYLRFSCGISQVYAIVNRLDRLMFITKALVGEHYLMYGLDSLNYKPRHPEGDEEERRWLREHDDTPSGRSSFDAGEMV
ncbi:BZ3500_MvSof-1268-A1-R1_Chr5-3g08313 [Microbotryum saponariae]|uniref:BZ3500_MvSof-1268-A1-R1_Chr5-3g08313 protein n=1 Tax=Microbotryum saponariae TaxID=289078 RepID=A0A2X0MK10_9BASI|nr:BZ3500_MvSof-1268-A1-R1_Chr5-3g08313 [Microbotryum saponariae]SDA08421.1 BZ3501_MvSof-1269-A2-R1_Chr5-3g08041 [Microbotryum saponariae]